MPTPTFRAHHVVPVLLGACLLAFMFASLAEAKSKTVPADLRVVDSAGKSLADGTQFSGTVTIKTDRKADCFGEGTGGSGDKARGPRLDRARAARRAAGAFAGIVRCPSPTTSTSVSGSAASARRSRRRPATGT